MVVFTQRLTSGSCNSGLILTQAVLWWRVRLVQTQSSKPGAPLRLTAPLPCLRPASLPRQVFFLNPHFPFLANSHETSSIIRWLAAAVTRVASVGRSFVLAWTCTSNMPRQVFCFLFFFLIWPDGEAVEKMKDGRTSSWQLRVREASLWVGSVPGSRKSSPPPHIPT